MNVMPQDVYSSVMW